MLVLNPWLKAGKTSWKTIGFFPGIIQRLVAAPCEGMSEFPFVIPAGFAVKIPPASL